MCVCILVRKWAISVKEKFNLSGSRCLLLSTYPPTPLPSPFYNTGSALEADPPPPSRSTIARVKKRVAEMPVTLTLFGC